MRKIYILIKKTNYLTIRGGRRAKIKSATAGIHRTNFIVSKKQKTGSHQKKNGKKHFSPSTTCIYQFIYIYSYVSNTPAQIHVIIYGDDDDVAFVCDFQNYIFSPPSCYIFLCIFFASKLQVSYGPGQLNSGLLAYVK